MFQKVVKTTLDLLLIKQHYVWIKDFNRFKKANEIYDTLIETFGKEDGVRDTKQIENLKHTEKKKLSSSKNQPVSPQNIADEVMQVISYITMNNNAFMKSVFHDRKHGPAVILFNDKMMNILRGVCCIDKTFSILGIDKTYNVDNYFVTITSFKHPGVLCKNTQESPIIFGHILIHGSSTKEVFQRFFSEILIGLGSSILIDLI